MKPGTLVLVAALGLSMLALVPTEARAGGNANFTFGGRGVDEDFWRPTEDHGFGGVSVDFGKKGWPVNIALGVHGSAASEKPDSLRDLGLGDRLPELPDIPGLPNLPNLPGLPNLGILDLEVESVIGEFSAGVLWRPKGERSFLPWVGGGVALMSAEKEVRLGRLSLSDDDDTGGLYINGGVAWRIGRHFNVGLDARLVAGADVELFGEKGDADYGQLGVLLGYGW